MNWWKYKGEANHLFGLPSREQEQSNMPGKDSSSSKVTKDNSNKQKKKQQVISAKSAENTSKEEAEIQAFKRKLTLWNDVLGKPTESLTGLTSTFQDMLKHIDITKSTSAEDTALLKALKHHTQSYIAQERSQKNKTLIVKVFYRLSYVLDDCEAADDFIRKNSPGFLHSMLHSNTNYYERFHASELRSFCLKNLQSTGQVVTNNVFYLPLDLQSVLTFIRFCGYDDTMSKKLWSIISLNLDSKVSLVRELTILVFMQVINDESFLKEVLLPEILYEQSWLNRNKYDLLGVIFTKYDYNDLIKDKDFEEYLKPDKFFKGLLLALNHDHLLASSQNLVRALAKTSSSLLNSHLIEVILTGSEQQIKHLVENFSKHLNLADLYEQMKFKASTTLDIIRSDDFEYLRKNKNTNLVICRNLFKQEFTKHDNIELIDNFIKQNCSKHSNYNVRRQVFQIWLDNVMLNIGNYCESLKNVVDFIKLNLLATDEQFISFMVLQIKKLLKFLIAKVPPIIQNERSLKADVKLYATTETIFELMSISANGKYERVPEIIICANIFFTYVGIYPIVCPTDKQNFVYRMIHNRLQWQHQQLTVLRKLSVDLLSFKNDAVRTLALKAKKILTAIPKSTSNDLFDDLRNQLILERLMYRETCTLNIDCVDYSKQYIEYLKLFTLPPNCTSEQDLNKLPQEEQMRLVISAELYVKVLDFLDTAITNFNKDPLQSLRAFRQPFAELNYAKLLFNKMQLVPTENDGKKHSSSMLPRLEKIADQMLKKLNLNDLTCWATPARMESSLDGIVRKSSCFSNLEEDKKAVLNSVWFSLEAVAGYACYLATTCMNNNKPAEIPDKLVIRSIKILTKIMLKCCQKDAIDATGQFLGVVINCLTSHWSDDLRHTSNLGRIVEFVKREVVNHVTDVHILCTLAVVDSHGVCTLFRQVALHDASLENELFNYCLTKLLPLKVSNAELIPIAGKETEVFFQKNHPIHLVLLSEIINTPELVEKLVPFMDKALILAFEQSKSPCDATQKAASCLLVSVTKKLANTSKYYTGTGYDLLPHSIAFNDLFTKYPDILSYITKNIGTVKALNILLLEFLCHFEFRKICLITDRLFCDSITALQPVECENSVYKNLLQQFIEKPELVDDKVELLVGKMDAQTENLNNLLANIAKNVNLFLKNRECQHFYAIKFCIKRYETYAKHMFSNEDFYERIKAAFTNYKSCPDAFMDLRLSVRHQLLDLLIDLGFSVSNELVNDVIQQKKLIVTVESKEDKQWNARVADLMDKK